MEMHHEQANPKNAVVSDVLPLCSLTSFFSCEDEAEVLIEL